MWGQLLSIGGSLLGGILGGNSQKKAAGQIRDAANQANNVLSDEYQKGLGYYGPYSNTGIIANTQINKLLGGDYSGFTNSPDYLAAMEAGGQALDRSAAARGSLYSGGHSADLMRFGQQTAAQYLGNYRNFLTGQQGLGFNAANNMAGLGQNYANNYGNNLLTGAGAKADATQANGNMWGGLAAGIGNIAGSWYANNSANNGGGTGWYLGSRPGQG